MRDRYRAEAAWPKSVVAIAWQVASPTGALLASLPKAERKKVTTGELVARLVKPATRRRRCRFLELPAMRGHVGKPRAFVSHVWSAPFSDLVAAIAHAVGSDEFVWVQTACRKGLEA